LTTISAKEKKKWSVKRRETEREREIEIKG
jgi:hypothetical protein